METVLLAAGKATRMGQAKLLLPFHGDAIIIHALRAALQSSSRVILVTGCYEDQIKALLEPFKNQFGNSLRIVQNKNPERGQFSSTQVGVAEVTIDTPFWIALADSPLINVDHYRQMEPLLGNYDGVRPFYHNIPGHPVLCAPTLRQSIVEAPVDMTVRDLLATKNIRRFDTDDPAWITDIDTPLAYKNLINGYDELR